LPGLTASKKNFSKREETFIARVILILFLLWCGLIPNVLSGLAFAGDTAKDEQKVTATKRPSALDE